MKFLITFFQFFNSKSKKLKNKFEKKFFKVCFFEANFSKPKSKQA